jgi:hypothetical protein
MKEGVGKKKQECVQLGARSGVSALSFSSSVQVSEKCVCMYCTVCLSRRSFLPPPERKEPFDPHPPTSPPHPQELCQSGGGEGEGGEDIVHLIQNFTPDDTQLFFFFLLLFRRFPFTLLLYAREGESCGKSELPALGQPTPGASGTGVSSGWGGRDEEGGGAPL